MAKRGAFEEIQESIPKRPCVDGFEQTTAHRRVLRSHYLVLKNIIHDEKEEICKGDSGRFKKIIQEADRLHQHVVRPREQVTDAQTLYDMANTLLTSVSSHSKDAFAFTPFDFLNSLNHKFTTHAFINWNAIGMLVSPIFNKGCGCLTMVGPMDIHLKQKNVMSYKRRIKSTANAARPQQLKNEEASEKNDTDKNMATMFNILRNKKRVRLEELVLNRFSFAQTVENLFALSFLAKDGRVLISVDEKGIHIVSPINAPDANLVANGEIVYQHFVFRFDYKDWELMKEAVGGAEKLMPHRYQVCEALSEADV